MQTTSAKFTCLTFFTPVQTGRGGGRQGIQGDDGKERGSRSEANPEGQQAHSLLVGKRHGGAWQPAQGSFGRTSRRLDPRSDPPDEDAPVAPGICSRYFLNQKPCIAVGILSKMAGGLVVSYRDLAKRPSKELVQRFCHKTSYRELVKKSCQDTSSRDLA